MKYPERTDIVNAVRNPQICFKETVHKTWTPIKNGIAIEQYAGAFSTVFPFNAGGEKKAVRIWSREVDNAQTRTQKVSEHLQKLISEYFVNFIYHKDAILINGKFFPIVVMDWIEGSNLNVYINRNINNKDKLMKLAEDFKSMTTFLHKNNLSHGDLQHGNILVRDSGRLVLVDYDSFYVPGMECFKDSIKGVPGYQHPKRNELKNLSNVSDYFSELVIYLSIVTYAEYPNYWQEGTEHLLFSKEDIENYNSSTIIKELTKKKNKKINDLVQNLIKFLKEDDVNKLSPLEDVLIGEKEKMLDELENEFKKKKSPKKQTQAPATKKPKIEDFDFGNITSSPKSPPQTTKPELHQFDDDFKKEEKRQDSKKPQIDNFDF